MSLYRQLSEEEIKLGFVSSCVEFVATALSLPYGQAFRRMKSARMLEDYIYRHYDAVHSQSRERVTADLIDYLKRAEADA